MSDVIKNQISFFGLIRLLIGFFGYIYCVITVRNYNTVKESKINLSQSWMIKDKMREA